jgi:fructose-specific phosphotransferase system IIC component
MPTGNQILQALIAGLIAHYVIRWVDKNLEL